MMSFLMQWLLESSDVGRPTSSKVKLCHTTIPVPSNGHPTSIRNTELKSVTHGQCNARPTVLYGRRASLSLDWYQIILPGGKARVCIQLAQGCYMQAV